MITITVMINYDANGVAQSVTIAATGFPPLSTLTVTINNVPVAVASTDNLGAVNATLAVSIGTAAIIGNKIYSCSWELDIGTVNTGDVFTMSANSTVLKVTVT